MRHRATIHKEVQEMTAISINDLFDERSEYHQKERRLNEAAEQEVYAVMKIMFDQRLKPSEIKRLYGIQENNTEHFTPEMLQHFLAMHEKYKQTVNDPNFTQDHVESIDTLLSGYSDVCQMMDKHENKIDLHKTTLDDHTKQIFVLEDDQRDTTKLVTDLSLSTSKAITDVKALSDTAIKHKSEMVSQRDLIDAVQVVADSAHTKTLQHDVDILSIERTLESLTQGESFNDVFTRLDDVETMRDSLSTVVLNTESRVSSTETEIEDLKKQIEDLKDLIQKIKPKSKLKVNKG